MTFFFLISCGIGKGLRTGSSNDFRKQMYAGCRVLTELAKTRMPLGKYKGGLLIDLPEPYVVWFSRKGFPADKLGDMLNTVYEIKVNGLGIPF
jgi:uncharacterized protein